jgi:hypothetical protein
MIFRAPARGPSTGPCGKALFYGTFPLARRRAHRKKPFMLFLGSKRIGNIVRELLGARQAGR